MHDSVSFLFKCFVDFQCPCMYVCVCVRTFDLQWNKFKKFKQFASNKLKCQQTQTKENNR